MIFGKKKKNDDYDDDEHEDEEDQEDIELVLFQGALNGQEANLKQNQRLFQVALLPTKELVTDALARRADLLRIEPKGGRGATITMAVDGIAYPGGRLPKQHAQAITQMLKLLSGLDIQERRKPQVGGVKAQLEKTKYELKVECVPVEGGMERVTIRALNLNADIDNPNNLGFPQNFREKIRKLTKLHEGMVLVCGPPGTGVTTTMHGVLRTIDCYVTNVYSIADTGTRELHNITLYKPKEGDDTEMMITRIIREEADVLFVDPIRDAEYAKLLFEQQKEISIVAEFAARDTGTAFHQLIQWVGDPQLVADGVKAIIMTKLLRLLCDQCKQAYRPNPRFLAKIGLPPETTTLYRHFEPPVPDPDDPDAEEEEYEICKKCGGLGYFGQVPLLEMIEMSDTMKELVSRKADPKRIRQQAAKEEMFTLQQDGLRLVTEGKTSLEELQRVFRAKR